MVGLKAAGMRLSVICKNKVIKMNWTFKQTSSAGGVCLGEKLGLMEVFALYVMARTLYVRTLQ